MYAISAIQPLVPGFPRIAVDRRPSCEILAGKDDPVVVAVCQRSIGARFTQLIAWISCQSVGETGIQILIFANIEPRAVIQKLSP